ncbi:MAG TPA: urea ABC transporter permease subunit UrtB [Tepidisphaeraceae bacterium]|jgi:urea transport system permease protein|nr:urea ABC transporter permease subunit UrtB [Tepidisphaeraceae bacterium]
MKSGFVFQPIRPIIRWAIALLLFVLMIGASRVCHAAATTAAQQPVPAELVAAIKSLKTADADARQKVYDLIAVKGDARLIPALKAYKNGTLLLDNDQLQTFGERQTLPDLGSVIPVIDAITGKPVVGKDGKTIFIPKPNLSKAMRAPRPPEKKTIAELIATLSLLDPDPAVRIASIRDAAEHAARAVPDPGDADQLFNMMDKCAAVLNAKSATQPSAEDSAAMKNALSAMAAVKAEKPKAVVVPAPSQTTVSALQTALRAVNRTAPDDSIASCLSAATQYLDQLDMRKKVLDDLPKTDAALKRQLEAAPSGPFTAPLHEAIASIDLIIGDDPTRIAAAGALGKVGTSRAANLLGKVVDAAGRANDQPLKDAAAAALKSANRYQSEVHFIQTTFAGLSAGSVYVLIALGLSIIFGLMGVINMAQGEFMMVGAFATFVVAQAFKRYLPNAYDYYLVAAVPAAFLASAIIGYIAESLVIRHLYGRPLETLLATWGIGLILIWAVRRQFGDNVSISPPHWMEGGWEVAPDLVFPLNRLYIILYCAICIAIVYYVVNGTKLGLLLRATTQNREMAAALGVATRRVDGFTFAFGAGLAGLAGVAVPLYNKINPNVGQEYIVDCFMVVVVGGVGKLAGVIWAGLGLGFIGKYLESLLGMVPSVASGASVIGKVLVLLLIICFLQMRPQGLFPPKGRNADA